MFITMIWRLWPRRLPRRSSVFRAKKVRRGHGRGNLREPAAPLYKGAAEAGCAESWAKMRARPLPRTDEADRTEDKEIVPIKRTEETLLTSET